VCRCRPWLAGEREGEREEGGCGLRVELCSFDTGAWGGCLLRWQPISQSIGANSKTGVGPLVHKWRWAYRRVAKLAR